MRPWHLLCQPCFAELERECSRAEKGQVREGVQAQCCQCGNALRVAWAVTLKEPLLSFPHCAGKHPEPPN
jgi:hypothetical protein